MTVKSRVPGFPQTLVSVASALAIAACGGRSAGTGSRTPDRQSEAEYDVSRDLFHRGQTRAALDHALKAVELDEDNEKALYFTAAIYLSFCAGERELTSPDCKLKEAEKFADRANKANPQFRDARNLLGQVYILEKRFKDAITVLEPLTRDPAYTESYLAWANLGWAQVQDGQVDAGIVSLKNAVTQPRLCVGHYRLGLAYQKKNDLPAAEKSLSDAVEVDSPDCQALQDAWSERARVRMKLGKLDDARKDFEKCRDLSAETKTGKDCVASLATLGGGKS